MGQGDKVGGINNQITKWLFEVVIGAVMTINSDLARFGRSYLTREVKDSLRGHFCH